MPREHSRRKVLRRIGTALGGAGLLGAAGTASAWETTSCRYNQHYTYDATAKYEIPTNLDYMLATVENETDTPYILTHYPVDETTGPNKNREMYEWLAPNQYTNFEVFNLHRGGEHHFDVSYDSADWNISVKCYYE